MTEATFYLRKALSSGEPIRYWQMGNIIEERFDVPDMPMEGEMDPFFFLTRHKNFIPHEYPCRRIFAEQFRGKRPQVRGVFQPIHSWLPFGSPRLDLSCFHFRPTRLATWARTFIDAKTEGSARVRLGTCGGAILWVNGAEVGWMAPYGRNLEEKAEFDLSLKVGMNEIVVFFDDLAERDIRYFFQIDYLSGPNVEVALPVKVADMVAESVEKALEGMHFDKTSYLGGDVTLCFARALDVDVDVNVAVLGDFISADRHEYVLTLRAGKKQLVIGPSEKMPAGFRNFRITLNAGGFHAARSLGVEICHIERQGKAPVSLAGRIAETLDEISEFAERDAVCAFARLASGRAGEETDTIIENILPSIEDCHDCADFSLIPLIWARTVWGERICKNTRVRLDRAVLGFRYWMDEPGNDVQWYFSENHALLFHTAAYLAGNLFRDAVFVRSGRKGSDHSAEGAARVRAWLDHFEAWEMAEFNSAPYFPIDLKGLTALAALSPDSDIAARAKVGIIRLCEIVAHSSHHGILTAAQGRSYEYTLCSGRSLELSSVARLLWGKGWYGGHVHALPQLAVCLRDCGVVIPNDLKETAYLQGDEHREWLFAQGADRFAKIYHYKSSRFAMGSVVHYRWNEWGYQETVLHIRLGERPEATLWINHPGETIQFGYGRPSFWGGCGIVPRVHQYRGLAVLEFVTMKEQADFTHVWFPTAEFDESCIEGDVAMARSGQGAVFLRGDTVLSMVMEGPSAACEVRQYGRRTRWIVRVCESESLEKVGTKYSGIFLNDSADGSFTIDDPEYGSVIFRSDGTVEAEGRVIAPDDFTVSGKTSVMAGS